MTRLLIATRNAHKAKEFAEMLGAEFEVLDLLEHPEIPETVESGKTFEENAILKAVAVSLRLPGLVLADDSGLEVEALHGRPGVFSARYAGESATDEKNVQKLLRELAQTKTRTARFACVLALARGGELLKTFSGTVEGSVIEDPRGAQGFGYDPIFVPNGFHETFAELPAATKNRISHRARALQELRYYLRTHLAPLKR